MIQNVRDSWIRGVLEPALPDTEFDLGMTLKPDAVLKHADFGDYALPTTTGILQVFDDLGKELLILGAPGAGKTILLLQLARELLNRTETDPRQLIPVVLNLSSWAADRKPLTDWLTERLKLEYGVPKKLATRWLENENLLLLLDGLDEVNEAYRNECVQAINTYRQQHRNLIPMVVCSRIADYDLLRDRLNLTGALLLQALTDEQVDFQISDDDYTALRQVMTVEPHLREMATTPFLLNAMTYTYRGVTSGEINRLNDEAGRRDHLFSRFVKGRLDAKPHESYSRAKSEYWLAWLANNMVKHNLAVFYLEGLQPTWLTDRNQRIIYRSLTVLAAGLIFLIVFSQMFILPYDIRLPQLSFRSRLVDVTLVFMFVSFFLSFMGLLLRLTKGLIGGFNTRDKVSQRSYPNQGIWISIRSGLFFSLPLLMYTSYIGLKFALMFGLASGLANGGAVAIQHLILRIMLTRAGYAPWNYAAFLDYCASVGILRKVGGGYIFAHRMLLEYFVGLAEENQNKAQAK